MSEALDDQNVAELQFGKEFVFDDPEAINHVQVLTNDEIYYLLDDNRQKDLARGAELTDTFKVTYEFLEKVATTTVQKDIVTVADAINQMQNLELERKVDRKKMVLHPYERASLANLVTDADTTPEEVIHWIPSLSRFDEEQLQKSIDFVVNAKGNVSEGI
jgi:hypothetical protein